MIKRLTDEELAELERRVRPGYVELFPHEVASLIAEVREMRRMTRAIVTECQLATVDGAIRYGDASHLHGLIEELEDYVEGGAR